VQGTLKIEDLMTASINNILVSRLRFMGDVILTTPLLAALRKACPQAHIGYLAESPYAELLRDHPHVDEVFTLTRGGGAAAARLVRALRRVRWDAAIDLFGNPRSALLLFLSGARLRIGGDYRGRRWLYTHRISDDGVRRSAIDYHLRYLSPLGIVAGERTTHIHVSGAAAAAARALLAGMGYDVDGVIVGLHPGATWPAKRWHAERFAALADRLADEGLQVLFTLGPGETERIDTILGMTRHAFVRPQILPLRSLAAVLQQLTVFVSNDCGPLHLAPAVGTRTVGIFGPGEPDIWFPYEEAAGHRLVHHTLDCSRCHRDFCETMACMSAITVEDVWQQIHAALKR